MWQAKARFVELSRTLKFYEQKRDAVLRKVQDAEARISDLQARLFREHGELVNVWKERDED